MEIKMHSKTCHHCGANFEAMRSTARFCSDKCRIGAHRGDSRPMGSIWLRRAATEIAVDIFHPVGVSIHAGLFDVSFGYPIAMQRVSYKGGMRVFIGGVTIGTSAIVIPPQPDTLFVLSVLVHEMVHIATPQDNGRGKHGKLFQKMADAVGLLPPYPATTASEGLNDKLKTIVLRLGPMPTPFDSRPTKIRQYIEQPDGRFLRDEFTVAWAPPRKVFSRRHP
jgi:hypothetical protein